MVRANRQPVSPNNPLLAWQETFSNLVEAQLDSYRDARDASQEMNFHAVYGALSTLTGAQAPEIQQSDTQQLDKELTDHLRKSLSQGGGTEALVRILFLLGQKSGKFSKDRVEQLAEQSRNLIKEHNIDLDSIREIIDQQALLVFAHPVESLETLPLLLISDAKRKVLLDNVAHLVPELLTAEGPVADLWRQLHQLFEQPIPAPVQPHLSTPSDSAATPDSLVLVEEKATEAKTSAGKLKEPEKPETHTATAIQQELPVATPQVDPPASDDKKAAEVKDVVKKPTKPKARKKVAKQQKQPAAAQASKDNKEK